ncbi:MAG: hypothetical protein ACK4UN_17130 [Limisphaerales bacterium]
MHALIQHALAQQPISPVENYPVAILVTARLAGRMIDCSNIPLKLHEDGLIAAGLLVNDDPAHVSSITVRVARDRNNPGVLIEICEQENGDEKDGRCGSEYRA